MHFYHSLRPNRLVLGGETIDLLLEMSDNNSMKTCLTGDTRIEIITQLGHKVFITLEDFVRKFMSGELHNPRVRTIKNNQLTWSPITNIHSEGATKLCEINDELGSVILRCTEDHEIYTGNRGYIRADDITSKDELSYISGVLIGATVSVVDEESTVYDITVPETECFFANGILVHNCIRS